MATTFGRDCDQGMGVDIPYSPRGTNRSAADHSALIDKALQRHLDFQKLLARLCTDFMTVPASEVDGRCDNALQALAEFMQLGRATLVEVDGEQNVRVTHSYARPGSDQAVPQIADAQLPWWAASIRQGQIFRLSSPDDLPPEVDADVKANLTIPLSVGGTPICAISVTSTKERDWSEQCIEQVRLVGEVLANALARKRMDEQMQRERATLAHLVRVSSVGQLATSIAHELSQPLCAMVSNAEAAIAFLSRDEPLMGEALEELIYIVRDDKRAGQMISRAHTMLKRHSVEYAPQEVNALVTDVLPLLVNYALLRGVDLQVRLSLGIPPITGHAVQLQQVVTNLIMNAVEAIPSNAGAGQVVCATSFDAAVGEVIVRVTDSGAGLPAGEVDRLFQPFVTSKPNGLGVGLAIARMIIEAHRGRLWAENNSDRGATFCFSIPASKEKVT